MIVDTFVRLICFDGQASPCALSRVGFISNSSRGRTLIPMVAIRRRGPVCACVDPSHTVNRAYYVVRMYYLCMYDMTAAVGGMYDFSFGHKSLWRLARRMSKNLTFYQKTKTNPILLPHCKQTPLPKRIIQPPPWRPPPASRLVLPSPRP